MKRISTKRERLTHIATILRNSWVSLETHLKEIDEPGKDFDLDWEIEAIQEYAESIFAATRLYP